MPRKGLIGMTLVMILLLPGCHGDLLEKLSIVYAIGYEANDQAKDQISATYLIPLYKKEEVESRIVRTQGSSTIETRNLAALKTGGKFVDEKTQVLLIDQGLAKQGVFGRLLTYYASRLNLPGNISLTVTETSPSSLLEMPLKEVDPGTSINNLLSKNENQGVIPPTNLLTFVRQHASKGQDPYLPLIRKDGSKHAQLVGIALFKDDRFVLSLKGYRNMLLFSLLQRSVINGYYDTDQQEKSLRMQIEHSRVKYAWSASGKLMKIRIKIHATLLPINTSPLDKASPSETEQMKKKAEQAIEQQISKLIGQLQRSNIDPIGLGAIARSQDRHWKADAWDKLYPMLKVQTTVKVNFDSERR
ncbi:Ger(x)C family spore germination protein [Paenibacillus lignilyticus]|uniref:Ger(X)C family spore germination protein n=1 Tax=Paenibacillus lignilyticus TaxID=1172615 RepID=A0ABS5CN00_9BACL|nr:Ger(x)C family spore germination protein [Paenibacillus lignilyticus]MBP3967211.1 Ger(x)C family spore germination protein [Paenibacillus lignilyticus]